MSTADEDFQIDPVSDRAVIQSSSRLRDWLRMEKRRQARELGRQVTYTEIIDQLREKAGAA